MSMFNGGDDRILLEEIVETSEEQEELCCKSEIVDDLYSITTNETFAEGIEVSENQQQLQVPQLQKKQVISAAGAGVAACRNVGQNVLLNGNSAADSVSRVSSHSHMEQERRMRREIANSNERRRMQSINAGFQSLRTLLPHHEGEKLSKAAILQQTAEYIYQLEQEKTQLLSQNCQLKRLINQHEGGDVPIKKRKTENPGVVVSLPISAAQQHVNDDEGLGSMSPDPLSALITVSADGHSIVNSNEIVELRRQLERERQARLHLEKQLKTMQNQSIFPSAAIASVTTTTTTIDRFTTDNQLIAYQPHEVIEHTDNVIQVGGVVSQEEEDEEEEELEEGDDDEEEKAAAVASLQVVSLVSLPPVGSTQTVETTISDLNSPPLSPQPVEVVAEEIKEEEEVEVEVEEEEEEEEEELVEDSESNSSKTVTFASQIFPSIAMTVEEQQQQQQQQQTSSDCSFSPSRVTTSYACTESTGTSSPQYITSSPSRPYSPEEDIQQRLPSVLEAAMKAEPKVEVERLPSPATPLDDGTPQARLYLANTSRQNLETIVEAIRHLEGDHLFSDEPAQDVPLALTNKPLATSSTKQRLMNNFLQFHSQQQQQQQAQQRPGVIVVKHS